MTIVLPLYCLAGNCDHISKSGFGVVYMPDVVDLMDKAFEKIKGKERKSLIMRLCLVSSTG